MYILIEPAQGAVNPRQSLDRAGTLQLLSVGSFGPEEGPPVSPAIWSDSVNPIPGCCCFVEGGGVGVGWGSLSLPSGIDSTSTGTKSDGDEY